MADSDKKRKLKDELRELRREMEKREEALAEELDEPKEKKLILPPDVEETYEKEKAEKEATRLREEEEERTGVREREIEESGRKVKIQEKKLTDRYGSGTGWAREEDYKRGMDALQDE